MDKAWHATKVGGRHSAESYREVDRSQIRELGQSVYVGQFVVSQIHRLQACQAGEPFKPPQVHCLQHRARRHAQRWLLFRRSRPRCPLWVGHGLQMLSRGYGALQCDRAALELVRKGACRTQDWHRQRSAVSVRDVAIPVRHWGAVQADQRWQAADRERLVSLGCRNGTHPQVEATQTGVVSPQEVHLIQFGDGVV